MVEVEGVEPSSKHLLVSVNKLLIIYITLFLFNQVDNVIRDINLSLHPTHFLNQNIQLFLVVCKFFFLALLHLKDISDDYNVCIRRTLHSYTPSTSLHRIRSQSIVG